jgi:hypothetical protein
MDLPMNGRILCLHAAAKRLGIPERTLRYRASRGRVPGAFKQGKLWKFAAAALSRCPGSDGVSAVADTVHGSRVVA